MKREPTSYTNIDEYIKQFPAGVQQKLQTLRQTIQQAAPEAAEAIKYQIPTFVLHGNLVHFAAYKNHIGFYPTPSGIEAFKEELSAYTCSKGAIQFLMDQPLPLELVGRIVQYRVAQNRGKGKGKK